MEGGERAGGEEPGLAVKVRRCELMESGRGEGKRGGGGAGGKRAGWVGSDLNEKKAIAEEPRGEGEAKR